jgi:cell fate (sporulation/competence/biofilm development) regulator YlbF (YheA/YmcA/DUF963 family)
VNDLIYDDQMIAIEDALDQLIQSIQNSQKFSAYQKAQQLLDEDVTAQKLITTFHGFQSRLQAIEPYGDYVPGAVTLKKQTLKAKRAMDFYPPIATYKAAQMAFETMIDTLSVALANSISDQIKVATGNPFFETKRKPHNKLKG